MLYEPQRTLIECPNCHDVEKRLLDLSRANARLANELRGTAEYLDGECLCDVSPCDCGGDGLVDGDSLEFGCAGCWARRLREVADGIDWPPRALAASPPGGATTPSTTVKETTK